MIRFTYVATVITLVSEKNVIWITRTTVERKLSRLLRVARIGAGTRTMKNSIRLIWMPLLSFLPHPQSSFLPHLLLSFLLHPLLSFLRHPLLWLQGEGWISRQAAGFTFDFVPSDPSTYVTGTVHQRCNAVQIVSFAILKASIAAAYVHQIWDGRKLDEL